MPLEPLTTPYRSYTNLPLHQYYFISTARQVQTALFLIMTHGDDLSPFQQWYQNRKKGKDDEKLRNDVARDSTRQNNLRMSSEPAVPENRDREEAEERDGKRLKKEHEEMRREDEERRRDQLGQGC
jgi:hypothetical protein